MTTATAPARRGTDPIFTPLTFPSGLAITNRVPRSNISGCSDNYDGSGAIARVNWEERFARGGVGAISPRSAGPRAGPGAAEPRPHRR
jgi:hypothetical protein